MHFTMSGKEYNVINTEEKGWKMISEYILAT